MLAPDPKSSFHLPAPLARALAPVSLAAIAFLVYCNTLPNNFVWDDEHLILLDRRLTDDSPLSDLFGADFFAHHDDSVKYGYYRPIVSTSYLLDTRLFGRNPTGFHLTNILMHIACVLLVWLLGRRLFDGKPLWALAGALLFAVHPIHTESVSWISGRTDVLAALFFLSALNLHIRSRHRSRPVAVIMVLAACASMAAALMSKEVALTLPLVVFLWERGIGKARLIPSVLRSLPYAALVGLYGALRFLVLSVEAGRTFAVAPHVWALTAAKSFWLYVGELLWPIPLVAHQTNPWLINPDWKWAAAGLATVLAIGIGIFLRKRRPAGFLYLAFAASLIPMANIIRISAPVEMGFPIAERFAYLPSAFFCLAAGYALFALPPRRLIGPAILAVLVLASVVATLQRNAEWRDDETFIKATLQEVPDSSLFMGMLAANRLRAGALEEAEAHYRQALTAYQEQTGNDHPIFATGLSMTLLQRGRHKEALAIAAPLEKVFTENPTIAFIVGEAHRKLDHLEQAEGAFVRSLSIKKDYIPARISLALVASARGDHERATSIYKTILSFDSNLPLVHEAMGDMHRRMGKKAEAVKEFERAIELNPSNHVAYGALASLAAADRDFETAEAKYRKALEFNPEFHEATVSLAMIRAERGDLKGAEQSMLKVLQKDDENAAAMLNLSILYARTGRVARARQLLTRLVDLEPSNYRARDVLRKIEAASKAGEK